MTWLSLWVALQVASAPAPAPRPGTDFDPPELLCTIEDPRLDEASGIVEGRANRGLYYTHNDSGGKPIVYVIDREGRMRAEWELAGATNVDWEDIAIAPDVIHDAPAQIYVADIGDNDAKRKEVVIYRFAEPKLEKAANSQPTRQSVTPTRFVLRYPDGPRNAEALVVHPTGAGFIITKHLDGTAEVYRIPAPWNKSGTIDLERVGKLTFPETAPIQTIVTAADIYPDGTQLVTRSYLCGWIWTLPTDGPNKFETLIRQTPVRLNLAPEPQGEAICFSADGRCLLTISEKTPTRLYECCRPKP